MLVDIGQWAWRHTRRPPWTNVYGLARSLLAAGTALTLAANSPATLFRPIAGTTGEFPHCTGPIHGLGFFCLFSEHLELARWLAVLVLCVVASGWRPRVTALPHWWLSLSFGLNAAVTDGGDQVTATLCLLLLPIALTDGRTWHWGAPGRRGRPFARVLAHAAFVAVRIQVAGIYLHAAAGKFGVEEWADGTALYYWFNHPTFGAPGWLEAALRPFLTTGFSVGMLTWGVILSEFLLAAGLVASPRYWHLFLGLGLILHLGIAIVHGLTSFSIAMAAALILCYRPVSRPFKGDWRGAIDPSVGGTMRLSHMATRGARWGAIVGLGLGTLYAVGGFFVDLFTVGLNGGTALAFFALLGMPLIFGALGFCIATVVAWIGLLLRWSPTRR